MKMLIKKGCFARLDFISVEEAIPVIKATLDRGRKRVVPIAQRPDVDCASDHAGGLFVWETELNRIAGDSTPGDPANVRDTFRAFERWIYSGNGFSQERYAKLKLERPDPPDSVVRGGGGDDDDGRGDVALAVGHGLECLRTKEGLDHAPGAITNPSAYAPGGIANPR